MKGRLVQLVFLAAFDRVNYHGLLYKLRSIGVAGQFLTIVSKFLSDRRQRVRLNTKVRALVNVVLILLQGSVLGPLLGIILWAMRIILRSMQSFLYRFCFLK